MNVAWDFVAWDLLSVLCTCLSECNLNKCCMGLSECCMRLAYYVVYVSLLILLSRGESLLEGEPTSILGWLDYLWVVLVVGMSGSSIFGVRQAPEHTNNTTCMYYITLQACVCYIYHLSIQYSAVCTVSGTSPHQNITEPLKKTLISWGPQYHTTCVCVCVCVCVWSQGRESHSIDNHKNPR